MKINIAIDGPSAAGKSTIAKGLAAKLGYVHLDTGAMYRCTAYKALEKGISLEDEAAVVQMLQNTDIRMTSDGSVYLDGENVSKAIRKDQISMAASRVSKLKGVRAQLVLRQQEIAKEKGYILDGRDIGTVVLPDAEVKVFMTATAYARAVRRLKQNKEKGIETSDLETIQKEIEERDYQDMTRANSPLKQAEDAIHIDTSDLSIEEVTQKIYALVLPWIQKSEVLV